MDTRALTTRSASPTVSSHAPGLVGFDAEWKRALAGILFSQSNGDGSYRQDTAFGNDAGTVESSLTGVYPSARVGLSANVSAWDCATPRAR